MNFSRFRKVACAVAFLVVTGSGFARAGEPVCRQALVIGLDVSGSVDLREYRLQTDGLVEALGTKAVRSALLSTPSAPVELLVFEWSGLRDQHILLPWTAITSAQDLAAVQQQLSASSRRVSSRGTAIGDALEFARKALEEKQHCWVRTLDISGDGQANLGLAASVARDQMAQDGITVNALVIGADAPESGDLRQAQIGELSSYFRSEVITGEDSFVQTALGYDAYGAAMARKLERELKTLVLSSTDGPIANPVLGLKLVNQRKSED